MRLLIVYRDFLLKGGLPTDARNFVSNFPKNVTSTIICKENDEFKNELNFEVMTLNSLKEIIGSNLNLNYDYAIFIGFSSLYNVLVALKIKIPYVLLPFSQINHFLDYDNPFYEHILPDVKNLENSKFYYPKVTRVKNGKRDLYSQYRRIKRLLFRKTIGYLFLKKAHAIGVLSNFELREIENLYKKYKFNNFNYRFGLYKHDLILGTDEYDSTDKLKLIVWSRTDFFYKGIDKILKAIKYLNDESVELAFKLYIAGPDYNEGYKKINEFIEESKISEHVQLIKSGEYTSGTLGLLAKADLSVCLSRWDGPPRVIRESLTLGVPVLASKNANFDFYLDYQDCGYLVENQDDLVRVLQDINRNDICRKKSNAQNFGDYFHWKNVSYDFISELTKMNNTH